MHKVVLDDLMHSVAREKVDVKLDVISVDKIGRSQLMSLYNIEHSKQASK